MSPILNPDLQPISDLSPAGAGRIIAGDGFDAHPMYLAQVLTEDGYLFCRYLASNPAAPA